MKIIESCVVSKYPNQELCEDGLFVSDKVIAVIDGVTSKEKLKWNRCSSGRWAMKVICQKLAEGVCTESAIRFFEDLNESIKKLVSEYLECERVELPKASVIAYIAEKNEVWSYGDCRCLIGNEFFSHEKLIDKELSNKRSMIIEQMNLSADNEIELKKRDYGREAILEDLKHQSELENVHVWKNDMDYGYPVINGTEICEDMIVCHKVFECTEIVLATDGYPILKKNLRESEEELARIIREDPYCYKEYKSTKGLKEGCISFDDRTYVRFKV